MNTLYLLAKKIDLSFFIRDIDNSKYNLCYALKREMLITHTLSEKDRLEYNAIHSLFNKIAIISSKKYNNIFTNIKDWAIKNNSPTDAQINEIKDKLSLINQDDLFDSNLTDILHTNMYIQACMLSELPLPDYKSRKSLIKNQQLQSIQKIEAMIDEIALDINNTNQPLEKMPQSNMAGEYYMLVSSSTLNTYIKPHIEQKFIVTAKINLINLLLKEQPEKITQAWLDQQQAARHPIIENATAQLDVEKQVICFDIQGTDADSKKTQQTYNCLPI